jgi:hypothetical protein
MQQLIEKLSTEYNLTGEEATGIVDTVKNYLAANTADAVTAQQPDAATDQTSAATGEVKEESLLEKAEDFIKDHIPGGVKEKAEEMFNGVTDKLKGMFK